MIHTIKSQLLAKYSWISHFFSTRLGGVSKPPFQFANLGLFTDDPVTIDNLSLLATQMNLEPGQFIFQQQIHSDNITIIDTNTQSPVSKNDAMITSTAGIMLVTTTADCVPLLLVDTKQHIIAAIHAGWRGSAKLITHKTIEKMKKVMGSKSQDIAAVIGPSIGPCCYNVGEDVLQAFEQSYGAIAKQFFIYKNNQLFLDLWKNNRFQLLEAGLLESNIDLMKICTSCNNNTFYSARCGDRGRQIAGIMINTQL